MVLRGNQSSRYPPSSARALGTIVPPVGSFMPLRRTTYVSHREWIESLKDCHLGSVCLLLGTRIRIAQIHRRVRRAKKGAAVNFLCLGPFSVLSPNGDVILHGSRRSCLLAALVVRVGQVVSVPALAEELWGWDPPESKVNALHVQVHRVRQDLNRWDSTALIVTRWPGYLLRVEHEAVDIGRFYRDLRVAQQVSNSDPPRSGAAARRALMLWRGEPFEGIELGPIAALARGRLRESRLLALDLAVSADLRGGSAQKAIPELLELVTTYPDHERFHEHLMLALYRSGRQIEALEVYRTARNRFVSELGVEPSPMFTRRMTEILHHDASLMPPWTAPY